MFLRLLDGTDPQPAHEVRHALAHVQGIEEISRVRLRWIGHRLHAELNIAVASGLSVEAAHEVGQQPRHSMMHHIPYLADAVVPTDPTTASGPDKDRISDHVHDGFAPHSHS